VRWKKIKIGSNKFRNPNAFHNNSNEVEPEGGEELKEDIYPNNQMNVVENDSIEIDLDSVCKPINSMNYFETNMDWMNIAQSMHEIKLYVTFLLENSFEAI